MNTQKEIDKQIDKLLSEVKTLNGMKAQINDDDKIKYLKGWTFEKPMFSASIGYYYVAKLNTETHEVTWISWAESDDHIEEGRKYKLNSYVAQFDSDISNLVNANREATEIEFLTHYNRAKCN